MSGPGIENRIRSGTPTPAETGKELQEQPEQQDSYVSELELKEVEQEEDEEEEIGEEARFFPPLWQQRRRLAQSIIEDHHATSVIDFGCGEGALLSFLVWETLGEFPITRIAGVDMDASRLEIAAETSQPQHFELGPNLRVHELSIEIYHGSVADPDIRMVGFDALACLEVIEHLDSDVLDKFWGVVLGALRPKVVIVSTPNAEFNIYFPQLKYGTAEAIFRNDDHRFEWTRQEFQNWCTPAAEQYGYSVTFTGVGRLPNSDPEVGHCTQFAILERQTAVSSTAAAVTATECYTLHARIDYPIYDVVHTEDEILTFLLDKIAHIRPRPSRPVSENGDDYYSLWERQYDNADDGQLESTPDIGIVVTAAEDEISTPTEDEINDRDREIGLGVLLLDDLWTSLDVRQRCKTRAAMVRILQKSTLVRVDEEQDKVLWDEEGDAFWREWDKEYAKQFERDDNEVDLQSLRDDEQEEEVGYYESEGYTRAEADGKTLLQDDGTTMGDFQSSRADEWGTTGWSRRSTEYQDSDDEDSPWRTPVIPESGGSGPTAWDM